MAVTITAIALSNSALFLFASGEGRYREIRQIDAMLSLQVGYIQRNYPHPEEVLIIAFDRSRQLQYYLPEYRFMLLFNPADPRYWETRQQMTIPEGIRAVIFPDLERNVSDRVEHVQRIGLGRGVYLYVAHVEPGDTLVYGYQYASVRKAAEERR